MKNKTFYKVISIDNKAINGGNFDYTDYLPKGNKPGKWLPEIKDLKECESGYHITNYWNMWINSEDNKIFEVEVENIQEKDGVGVIDKYVCGKFRFVKEIKVKFDNKSNTGYRNTGNSNTGNWNTGYSNTGYSNTGDSNTGYRNAGNSNTGNWNTGYSNTGDSNTGYRNAGNSNTGNWNTSNFNTGFFNTEEVKIIKVFNKDCEKEIWNKCKKPNFIYFSLNEEGDYKKSFKESFNKSNKEDVELLIILPNFNYKIFEEISGISEKMIKEKLK